MGGAVPLYTLITEIPVANKSMKYMLILLRIILLKSCVHKTEKKISLRNMYDRRPGGLKVRTGTN